jgi:hypothetical protein
VRHREAWAEEQRSPTREDWGAQSTPPAPASVSSGTANDADEDDAGADLPLEGDVPRDVLIVASKLKKYIRARSGMNTSDSVMDVLSARVRTLCDDAIVRAHEDGRKTVMDRDF